MKKSSAGFTLVELIVVLLLMTLLVSIVIWNTFTWQDRADKTRQDEYAKTLFLDAQHRLTAMKGKDILEDFIAEEIEEKTDENIFVFCEAGDLEKHEKGIATASKTAGAVFKLLEEYVNDREILNKAIAIRFTSSGKVLAVYYSDAYQKLPVDISDKYVKEKNIGFYGE